MPVTSPTKEQFPLSHKKVIKKTIGASTIWMIVLGPMYIGCLITFALYSLGPIVSLITTFVTGLLAIIIITLNYLYQKWYFDTYYYDLQQDYIVIRKDPITPREITIPYERIQDVYVDQDLYDRIFGLFDAHLSSATISSGMEAHIDGLEKPAADGIRAALLQIVGQRISKKS